MPLSHWDDVWAGRPPDEVSWYQPDPAVSVRLIESVTQPGASVVDIGGGASSLADRLLSDGYTDIAVLDIAPDALEHSRERLGDRADDVGWIVGDVTTHDFARHFDLWHDRAVLHFLTGAGDRSRYANTVRRTVAPGGHVILATFSPTGPTTCSGLPVRRYDADMMRELVGAAFEPVEFVDETHTTPAGGDQDFLYGLFRQVS